MKKMTKIWFALSLVAVLLASTAFAHSGAATYQSTGWHEQIEKVIDDGSYEDLSTLREKRGITMMLWVDSQEDLELMQKQHQLMGKYHEEDGFSRSGIVTFSRQAGGGCHG